SNPPSAKNLNLYAQLVKELLNRHEFQNIVTKHQANKYSKKFDAWSQLIWMLFCQLGGCHSIRDISNVLRSITGNINHLGVSTAPSKSTIAYQNTHRSWKVFRDYYYVLRQRLGQQRGNWHGLANIGAKIKLLDSSTITMSLSAFPWAHYTHEKGAVKLHTLLDLDMQVPDFIHITDGKHTDAKSAFEIPISKGEVIVADRGYQDFELLRFWDSKKAFHPT
ncbi:MAG: IS4 family transposase, partial [Akkermansia sp.]